MSAKPKKKSATAVRYSAEDKKKILDYIKSYNAANGRGGQSAAVKKFKVAQLTIAGWLKGPGKKAAGKAAKGGKAGGKGQRYSAAEKQEVVRFVKEYNDANGRGGQNQAAKKFNLSVLTVSAWLKAAGVKGAGKNSKKIAKAAKPAEAPKAEKAAKPAKTEKSAKVANGKSGLAAKVTSLIQINEQVRVAENELEKLYSKQDAIMASIKSWV